MSNRYLSHFEWMPHQANHGLRWHDERQTYGATLGKDSRIFPTGNLARKPFCVPQGSCVRAKPAWSSGLPLSGLADIPSEEKWGRVAETTDRRKAC
jgi:hypothetical protein